MFECLQDLAWSHLEFCVFLLSWIETKRILHGVLGILHGLPGTSAKLAGLFAGGGSTCICNAGSADSGPCWKSKGHHWFLSFYRRVLERPWVPGAVER
mmetsp:Transcript_92051/g.276252  ORF Transcript_92051/g.276252 Transcript_92051/m.276252 type:complete len:98 (-) Transcript_92051:637-930(-)